MFYDFVLTKILLVKINRVFFRETVPPPFCQPSIAHAIALFRGAAILIYIPNFIVFREAVFQRTIHLLGTTSQFGPLHREIAQILV